MEGVGDSYGDFMHRVEEVESASCSSIFKQGMKNSSNNSRKSCSIVVPGQQGVNRHGISEANPSQSHCRSVSQPAFLTVDQSSSGPSGSCVPEGHFFDRLPPISPASAHMPKHNPLGASRPCAPVSQFGSSTRRGHRRTCSEVPCVFSQAQMDQIMGKEDGDLNMEGVELGDGVHSSNYERENVKGLDGGENDVKERVCKGSETSDVLMRSGEGSEGTHLRTDSGGSVKEKNDKDVDWISSEDEADSEGNLMGNQSRNEKGKEGGSHHQSFGGRGHNRSVSMDSILSNNVHGLHSPKDLKLSPSGQNQSGRDFRRSSTDRNINLKMELGGEFTEAELKKILSNEKLTEIARSDPRRAKRILANRLSAARSKERKMLYMTELEGKVQTLQTEATTLSAQLTLLQRDLAGLANENSGLKLRLQGMEQQAQLQDALNKALMEEVQRLKLATGQPVAEQSTGLAHQVPLSSQLFQFQQHGLQHQQHVADSVQSSGQNQNGTFQNSNNTFQQLMGGKQDAQNICAGYGNNH